VERSRGQPELGACRLRDAGPVHAVNVSPFWMAQATISDHDLELFSAQRNCRRSPSQLRRRSPRLCAMVVAGTGNIPPSHRSRVGICLCRGRNHAGLGPNGQPCGFACSWHGCGQCLGLLRPARQHTRVSTGRSEESDGTRSNFELVRAGTSFRVVGTCGRNRLPAPASGPASGNEGVEATERAEIYEGSARSRTGDGPHHYPPRFSERSRGWDW